MHPEPILISALEHWSYCPRQCGLIHIEHVWDENLFTLRGQIAHERVDEPVTRSERGARVERALPLWSEVHGLTGKADAVEFRNGKITPIEYKIGDGSQAVHASLQLCAQALCLEEMFRQPVPEGALYFIRTKQRQTVELTAALRTQTIQAIAEIRASIEAGVLPEVMWNRRCSKCSLIDACLPHALTAAAGRRASPFQPRTEADLP